MSTKISKYLNAFVIEVSAREFEILPEGLSLAEKRMLKLYENSYARSALGFDTYETSSCDDCIEHLYSAQAGWLQQPDNLIKPLNN